MPTNFSPETSCPADLAAVLWSANAVPVKSICSSSTQQKNTHQLGLILLFSATLKTTFGGAAALIHEVGLITFHCIRAVITSCHQMPAYNSFSSPSSVSSSCPAPPTPLQAVAHYLPLISFFLLSFRRINKLIFKLCFVKGVHNLKFSIQLIFLSFKLDSPKLEG